MNQSYICIEGNIGAGKTSFATRFAAEKNSTLILEQFADNPFLPGFYENPQRFAFALELFFMAERYQQLKENSSGSGLFERGIVSDYLFVKSMLFARVNLSEEEFRLYSRLFEIIYQTLPQPDLLVYLHCPVERLMENIRKRGRGYEKNISAEYLGQIQETYFNFFRTKKEWKILIIDISGIDFVNNETDYKKICGLINAEIKTGITRVIL